MRIIEKYLQLDDAQFLNELKGADPNHIQEIANECATSANVERSSAYGYGVLGGCHTLLLMTSGVFVIRKIFLLALRIFTFSLLTIPTLGSLVLGGFVVVITQSYARSYLNQASEHWNRFMRFDHMEKLAREKWQSLSISSFKSTL